MAEPALQKAYEFLYRSTTDGVLLTDSSGQVAHINPAGAAMLGVTVEEVTGKAPEHVFTHNPALVNLFTRPGDQLLEVRLPKRRVAVGLATTLPDDTRMVLLQDITERHTLEARREALVQTMAHDLRNPISAIGGFADLVAKFGDLNEQQQRFLTRIRQTTSKLYDVAGSLVDLAWIEAGMPLAHQPLALDKLIDRAIISLGTLALEHKITIAVSLQHPLAVIMGDPERMYIVIYNLLHNAILYSHEEQTIAIHAWSDTREIYCSVADRGIGIADDELEMIFDRLYRSRDERVRETPGGGLGLTISRTIVRRHGGDIWATSNLGQGSTFTFVLPAAQG